MIQRIRAYFDAFPHVVDNWIKLLIAAALVALLPGWWAVMPLLILLTVR